MSPLEDDCGPFERQLFPFRNLLRAPNPILSGAPENRESPVGSDLLAQFSPIAAREATI